MLRGTWPIFLMPALAFTSMLWSPDPGYTLRKGVAFTGSVLIGFLVATVLNTQDAVRLLGRVLSFIILLSIVYVFIFPHYGVHNASDFFQSVHAGHWRGVFSHRTALGHVAGVSIGLLICYGSLIWSSRILRYAIVVLSLACIIKAGSGGGFLTAAIFPLALLGTQRLTRIRSARRRRTVLLSLLATALPLILLVPKIFTAALAVLNKQADLTGRVPLWDTLVVLAQERPFLGYGYAAGFRDEIQPQVLAATGNVYAHCHNGYLEVLMAFGSVGLAILLAVIIWLLTTTGRLVVNPPAHLGPLSGFPFIVVIYVLGANCIESYLIIECNAVALLALAAGLATRARIEARDLHAQTASFRRD
ncbi:O-antigen ligase family protein [Bradyrhizobium sp. UFLA05-109]